MWPGMHRAGDHRYVSDRRSFPRGGTLNTHQGQYPAGSFVWFPEGGVMQHGATEDADCTFLFITNKEFAINFVGDADDPHAPTMEARPPSRP